MTTQQQKDFIRSKCIEANDSIKDLVFGCKYMLGSIYGGNKKYQRVLRIDFLEEDYCGECMQGTLCSQSFVSFKCGKCKKTKSWHNGCHPKWCTDCSKKKNICKYCKRTVEIIGRDIRLADVLLAVLKKDKCDGANILRTHTGEICLGGFKETNLEKIIIELWNLLKDNLDDQTPETIEFIYQLLK